MSRRPNILLIVTDNQSPWTLGCYGNAEIRTPRIDALAAEGLRFDQAFCVNPVCSPNRATLMTGLMPSQHGVHNWLGAEQPGAQLGPDAYCTIAEFADLPRTLAAAGYDCGLAGKWHLGGDEHPQLGFRYWFTKCGGHTADFFKNEAVWQGERYIETRYFPQVVTEHAVDFLRQDRGDAPFFLYLPYNAPYGLDHAIADGHDNRHAATYAEAALDCFPRTAQHPWQRSFTRCLGSQQARRSYAAAVSGMDDQVGAVLDALTETGVADETLVIVTADHGLCGGHHGFWGMADHCRPCHLAQTNMRVPLIIRHPGHVPAGSSCDAMVSHYDFWPTMLDYLGLTAERDDGLLRPGQSYAAALRGEALPPWPDRVYYEYEELRAIQSRDAKLLLRHETTGPNEHYDLAADPDETRNLYSDTDPSPTQQELATDLAAFFARYSQPAHDIWRGGHSKSGPTLSQRG